MKEALYTLGRVFHNLQKERGCISIFLYSEGKLFAERTKTQFCESDKALQAMKEGLNRWEKTKSIKPAQLSKLKPLLAAYNNLPQLRANSIAQKTPIAQLIDNYSHHLIAPLLQTMVEIALNMPNSNPTAVSAYNSFLQWKERIGLERAIGARGFVKYSFLNNEFLERILFLLSEQRNCRNTYLALANDAQRQLVEQVLSSKASVKLRQLHTALSQSPESAELYELTPEKWFDLVTAKIDSLHLVERKLIDTLDSYEYSHYQHSITTEGNKNSFGEYDNLIKSLPLFSGLSAKQLHSLLLHSQMREFNKGKLLFLAGEQANRLYIILKGWVKIFKGTSAGEETILQMLSSGDSILESAVFLNTVFPVSAQIAEDATLLSIPAPILREQVKSNNDLALNLLASMSHRSQGLIRQIEDARLKSVDERIGWFLLRLLLEQGRISRCVKLPYDKSLIASYLDMKRETFSRSLKRLKAKGFKIENDTIIIPSLSSLCGFCDSDTAQLCRLHGTEDCPNPNCQEQMAAYA